MKTAAELLRDLRAIRDADAAENAIPLPWSKPPLSGNDRGHTRYSPFTRVKGEAVLAIRAAKVEPVDRAIVTLHYRVPDWRRRDADNLAPTYKACQDALVAAGVIADDSFTTIPEARQHIHDPVKGKPGALWLTIQPAD